MKIVLTTYFLLLFSYHFAQPTGLIAYDHVSQDSLFFIDPATATISGLSNNTGDDWVGLGYDIANSTVWGSRNNISKLDLNTGVITDLYSLSSLNKFFFGMDFDNNNQRLFAVGIEQYASNVVQTLYNINTTTGVPVAVGDLGMLGSASYATASGDGISGLAYDTDLNTLWGFSGNSKLYSINPLTGVATFVANILVSDIRGGAYVPGSSKLYCINSNADLYEINKVTGAIVTTIPGNGSFNFITGLASVSSATIGVPVVTFPAISPVCVGSTFTPSNTYTNSPTSYAWTGSAGVTFSNATAANPVVTFSGAGTFSLTVIATNATGTSVNATQTITVNALPTASFSYSNPICVPTPTTVFSNPVFSGTTGGVFSTPPGGLAYDNVTGGILTDQSLPGNYLITYTIPAAGGCPTYTATATAILTNCIVPTASFVLNPTLACINTNVTTVPTYTGSPTGYVWTISPASYIINSGTLTSASPSFSFLAATTYTVSVLATNAFGASSSFSQTIVVSNCAAPNASFLVEDSTLCNTDSTNLTDNSTNNPTSWAWSVSPAGPVFSSLTVQNPSIKFPTFGTFTITLIASNGSINSTSSEVIVVDDVIDVNIFTPDTTLILGEDLAVSAIGTGPLTSVFSWSENLISLNLDNSKVLVNPILSTSYVVTLTSPGGCVAKDTINITVFVPLAVGVPDAFSPNGDGVNDILFVKGEALKSIDFKVFNRLGQLVFESTQQDLGWDGKFKGVDENSAGFVYLLNYIRLDASRGTLKGTVTIQR